MRWLGSERKSGIVFAAFAPAFRVCASSVERISTCSRRGGRAPCECDEGHARDAHSGQEQCLSTRREPRPTVYRAGNRQGSGHPGAALLIRGCSLRTPRRCRTCSRSPRAGCVDAVQRHTAHLSRHLAAALRAGPGLLGIGVGVDGKANQLSYRLDSDCPTFTRWHPLQNTARTAWYSIRHACRRELSRCLARMDRAENRRCEDGGQSRLLAAVEHSRSGSLRARKNAHRDARDAGRGEAAIVSGWKRRKREQLYPRAAHTAGAPRAASLPAAWPARQTVSRIRDVAIDHGCTRDRSTWPATLSIRSIRSLPCRRTRTDSVPQPLPARVSATRVSTITRRRYRPSRAMSPSASARRRSARRTMMSRPLPPERSTTRLRPSSRGSRDALAVRKYVRVKTTRACQQLLHRVQPRGVGRLIERAHIGEEVPSGALAEAPAGVAALLAARWSRTA